MKLTFGPEIVLQWYLVFEVFASLSFVSAKKKRRKEEEKNTKNPCRVTFVFRYLCSRAFPVRTRIEETLAVATKKEQSKSVRSCLSVQVAYKHSPETKCQKYSMLILSVLLTFKLVSTRSCPLFPALIRVSSRKRSQRK